MPSGSRLRRAESGVVPPAARQPDGLPRESAVGVPIFSRVLFAIGLADAGGRLRLLDRNRLPLVAGGGRLPFGFGLMRAWA